MGNITVWRITPKTNLHVGNENTSSYGIIDLAVQRDALTNLPCINASSLKGAIREFAISKGGLNNDQLVSIFGSDADKKNTQKGGCAFFDAQIIAIPKQQPTGKPFVLVKSKENADAFINKAKLFGVDLQESDFGYTIVSENDFNELCDDYNLPIIARNTIENGTSANLWYEQVIPAETVFYTFIEGNEEDVKGLLHKKIVQIGANATIGYGYCLFEYIK